MKIKLAVMGVSLALSLAIGFATRGGTTETSSKATRSRPIIGLSLDTLKEARWQTDSELFRKKCEELGADVLIQSANGDDSLQINQCESLLTNKIDVLVIVPHDSDAMSKAVKLAAAAGVPSVAYDRIITNSPLDVYLSFDNVKVGRMQAQWLLDHLPTKGKGRIVRIFGSKTDHNASLFKQGQDVVLQPFIDRGDVQVVGADWADDWRPDNAKRIVDAAITKVGIGGFDGILASNDSTATGAYQCLVENGLAGKVLLTGQDADLVACQRIAAGTQSMTIYKPLKSLASRAADTAVKLANRKPIIVSASVNNGLTDVPSVLGEIFAVDKDNMMQTVIADGLHTKEAVYGAGK